jgi:N-acyl amino acid synthase of PEP-CTERM/exosortase system
MPENFPDNRVIHHSPLNISPFNASAVTDQRANPEFLFSGIKYSASEAIEKEQAMKNYDSIFRLRYQVYCHEAHFLNPDDYADGLEYDEFDAVSEHFHAKNPTGGKDVVGTVRLVKWSEGLSFPTQKHFQSLTKYLQRLEFPLSSTAEISRLCITKEYKRGLSSYSTRNRDRQWNIPAVLFELFKSMYLTSKYALGITHWVAAFESSLYRLMTRYGVHFKLLVPDEIEYHGKVKIYGASLAHIEMEMKERRPDLYSFFHEQAEYTCASLPSFVPPLENYFAGRP